MVYANPCEQGTPLTDDLSGAPIACALRQDEDGTVCPSDYQCTAVAGSTQAVCCPTKQNDPDAKQEDATDSERPQTSKNMVGSKTMSKTIGFSVRVPSRLQREHGGDQGGNEPGPVPTFLRPRR